MVAVPQLEFFIVFVMNRLNKVEELLKVQFDKNEALTEIVARQGHRSSGGGGSQQRFKPTTSFPV